AGAPRPLPPGGAPGGARGRPPRPLGPAQQGWATAADAYRAMLHGTPYPVRGMVGFGTNLLLSAPGAGIARAALASLDFLVYADLFLTPTAALADVVLPIATAWEREGLQVGVGPTQEGARHAPPRRQGVQTRGAGSRRGAGGAGTLGPLASGGSGSDSPTSAAAAPRPPAAASCWSRRASR